MTPNTILMLDDNLSELERMRAVCGPLGLTVQPVDSIADARKLAIAGRPLATIVGLKTIDGTETGVRQLKAVKELTGVPVVAFGEATLDEIRRTFVAGADDHLSRPLDSTCTGSRSTRGFVPR